MKSSRRLKRMRDKTALKAREETRLKFEALIKTLNKEHASICAELQNTIETLRNRYKAQINIINDEAAKEILSKEKEKNAKIDEMRQETERILKAEREKSIRRQETMKSEAIKHIEEINRKAKAEIERANRKETEYHTLIQQMEKILGQATAKLVVIAEQHDNFAMDVSKMHHLAQEVGKITEEFEQAVRNNQKKVTQIKQKELDQTPQK